MLEHHYLVRRHCPLAQQVHIAGLHSFDQSFWLEPASLCARTSGGDFTAPRDGLQHPFDVVVSIGRFLTLDGTVNAVAH